MGDLNLCGDSYSNPALAAAAQQSLNLYREDVQDSSGTTGKSKKLLVGTPGYSLLTTCPDGNIRGLWSGGGHIDATR